MVSTWNSAANPRELMIDPASGQVSLELSAERKRDYEMKLEITTVGGNKDKFDAFEIDVSVLCGLQSTTLTAPSLEILQKGNIYDDSLAQKSQFGVSNELCPITNYELIEG